MHSLTHNTYSSNYHHCNWQIFIPVFVGKISYKISLCHFQIAPVVAQARSHAENKLLLGCKDGSLVSYRNFLDFSGHFSSKTVGNLWVTNQMFGL